MRTALYAAAAVAVLLTGVTTADAAQRRYDSRDDRRPEVRDTRGSIRGDVHVVFSTGDSRVIREYYEPRYRRLPPGLQKKYYRTGSLPPGWQKKMRPLPWAVERRLVVLPPHYRRGVIDNHAVIYAPRTGVVIDATILF